MTLLQVLRFLLSCVGGAFFYWVYFDPRFRDAEGYLLGTFCLPVSIGVALIVLGWTIDGRFRRFSLWFGLGLLGQAVALQMIDAGPLVRYQHFKPFIQLVHSYPLLLLFLLLQTALVVAGCATRWGIIRAWAGRTFKIWQLAGVVIIFILSSAVVSRDVPIYITELLFAAFVQAVNLGNIVLMVWALPEEILLSWKRRIERSFGQSGSESRGTSVDPQVSWTEDRQSTIQNLKSKIQNPGVDRFVLLAALWVVVLAAVLSFFVYEKHPHMQDEVIYLYHANYFANGNLTTPAPPVSEAFSFYMLPYRSDRWFSIFPPGWPAMLSIGVLLGVPWLVNPILSGINVVLTSLLIREIYDRRTSLITVLLLCSSPWFVFMAMNFMSHNFSLTCALVAALAVSWARKTGNKIWALLGGFSAGILGLVRPLDGLVIAAILGLWGAGLGGQRLKITALGAFVIGCIATNSIVLPYNKAVTGDSILSPLTAYYNQYHGAESNAFGFGPNRGLGWAIDPLPGHSPMEALINANLNTFSINVELFGWSTGSLILIVMLLFCQRLQRSDYLMLAATVGIVAAYSFYWFSGGPDFGARYWYLTVVPLTVLTARGIQFVSESLERGAYNQEPRAQSNDFPLSATSFQNVRVIVGVASLCVFALANYFPWRAIDKYYHYLGMRPDIRNLARQHEFGKSLVLIRGKAHPDYASAWIYNSWNSNNDRPVYAWDRNPEARAKVIEAYPDRLVWLVDGPTITNGSFKLIDGPRRAHELSPPASAFLRPTE